MIRFLIAAIRNWKTSSTAVAALVVALAAGWRAFADDDPNTSIDFNAIAAAISMLLVALQGFASRDADTTSEASGVR